MTDEMLKMWDEEAPETQRSPVSTDQDWQDEAMAVLDGILEGAS